MTRVTVLGSVTIRTEESQWETLAPNARQLLAIMVAAGPGGLSFERVADELWPGELPATWDASLRMAFTRLRKRLPTGSLTNKARWCRLALPVDDVDVWYLASIAESGEVANADALAAQLGQEAFPLVEISPLIRDAIDQFDLLRTLLLEVLVNQNATVSPLTAVPLRSFAATRDWDPALAHNVAHLTAGATAAATSTTTAATELPPSLARHRAHPSFARSATSDELASFAIDEQHSVALLAAVPTSRRSATLAELGATMAAAGWRVVHLEPTRPAAAFGPFLQAMPALREPLLAALASGASDAQVRSRCWASILQALDHPDLPTCLIVDDAELLDSNSEEALAFVGRCRTEQQLSIVLATNATGDISPEWINAPRVHLAPLPPGQWSDTADRAEPRKAETTNLDDQALAVAVAASIVQSPISLESLEHMTQQPPHRVLTAIDELLGVGILTETSRPDIFELGPSHQPAHRTGAMPPTELANLSRRAMTLPGRSPVAVAADALRAKSLIDEDDLIKALLVAADSLAASQSHREAVAYFQSAEDLGAELSVETMVSYATSLELAGTDATDIRTRTIALALNNNQPGRALEAALAGLPQTERVDGDIGRCEMIESIDPSLLTRVEQLQRHLALSRQLMLLSRRAAAKREVLAARELVETIEEEADVWLALVHIDGWMPTGDRHSGFRVSRFHSPVAVGDLARRARLLQASAVSALIAGDFVTAADEADELTAVATESEDPLRIWHALLLRRSLLVNELGFDTAERTADEARDLGVSFGLSGAIASRLAQQSSRAMVLNESGNTGGRFEAPASEATRSFLAQAAACLQLARVGRATEAADRAGALLATSAGSRFEIAVAGLLSAAVGAAKPALRGQIADSLKPLRGTLLVVGAGLTTHGPVESLLANVAHSEAAALDLRHQAVELADTWESPLWQIVTRIHLGHDYEKAGRSAEQRKHLSEAAERAANTEFAIHECWGLFES